MTLKLSVILGAAGGVRHKRFRPANGLERSLRSWLELLPPNLKLNFSLMTDTSSRWPNRAALMRMTTSCGVMRRSCA